MKKNIPDNLLIWEAMAPTRAPRVYSEVNVPGISDLKNDPPEKERQLPDLGVDIVFTDQVDSDDDRYWPGWELFEHGKRMGPIDWTYSDNDLTLDQLEAQVRRNMAASGVPRF